MPTAAEILRKSGLHYQAGILDATRKVAPLFHALQAFEMVGTKYLTLALASLPAPNGFKNLDEGFVASRGAFAMGEVNAHFINTGVKEPVDSTDLWNASNANMIGTGDVDDWVTTQIKGTAKVEFKNVDTQIIKGVSNSTKGFIGLRDALSPALSANVYALTDSPEDDNYAKHALNAGGSTATTGSRIFLLSSKADGVSLRLGGPTGLAGFLDFGDVTRQYADETDALDAVVKTNEYYIARAKGYVGLAIFGSSEGTNRKFTQRIARCAFNVTAQAGYTASESLLDSLLYTLPPENRDENLIFVMSGRSGRQVAASKAANTQVNIMVAAGDAARRSFTSTPQMPDNHNGIPIIYSDDIVNNDAIVTPA